MKLPDFFPFRSPLTKADFHAHYAARARLWPVPSETAFLETPSGQTYVRMSGSPADPPLVLLPGSRAHSLTWMQNISALSTYYRVFALDTIYDVGMSVRRQKLSRPEHLVMWLEEVLAVLVPEGGLRLAGISYGGWLVSQYSLRFPHRVNRQAWIAPAATVLPVSLPFLLRAVLLVFPRKVAVEQFLYWLLQDLAQSGVTGRVAFDQAVEDWMVALRSFGRLPLINATVLTDQELRSLQVPTLYLDGANEKVYSARKAAARLNRLAPQIKTEIIPESGHDVWMVQAELVNRKLLDFLGEPDP